MVLVLMVLVVLVMLCWRCAGVVLVLILVMLIVMVVLVLVLVVAMLMVTILMVVMVLDGRFRRGLPRDGQGPGGDRLNGLHRQELPGGQGIHRALVQQRLWDHGGQRGVLRRL